MELIDYSEKAWVINGDTKPHKEQLQEMGGKFNSSLRVGVENGWVFAKSKVSKEQLEEFLAEIPVVITPNNEKESYYLDELGDKVPATLVRRLVEIKVDGHPITVDASLFHGNIFLESYSDKAWVVYGETKPHKDAIKEYGGRYNGSLRVGKGWIFSKSKHPEETLRDFLTSLDESYYLHDNRKVPAELLRKLVEIKVENDHLTIPADQFFEK